MKKTPVDSPACYSRTTSKVRFEVDCVECENVFLWVWECVSTVGYNLLHLYQKISPQVTKDRTVLYKK